MLDPLKSHYRTLLDLDESWPVTNMSLDVAEKRVTIALEFVGAERFIPNVELNRFVERRWFGVARLQVVGCDLASACPQNGLEQ